MACSTAVSDWTQAAPSVHTTIYLDHITASTTKLSAKHTLQLTVQTSLET